jgi:hypothetical protein
MHTAGPRPRAFIDAMLSENGAPNAAEAHARATQTGRRLKLETALGMMVPPRG